MCLAIPGKIQSIHREVDELFSTGKVSFGGIVKEISLGMVPEAKLDDYVLVHVGIAISVIDEAEALKTLGYLKEIGEMEELRKDEN